LSFEVELAFDLLESWWYGGSVSRC